MSQINGYLATVILFANSSFRKQNNETLDKLMGNAKKIHEKTFK